MLLQLIEKNNWYQVLVFSRTKHGANRLAKYLDGNGIQADAIHGNKSQAARMRALNEFKKGDLRVLVATDIASRGIDIDQLPQVINFDLPDVPEDYVHRIGRTGRAGQTGHAISIVSPDEFKQLRSIQGLIKKEIKIESTEGFELSEDNSQHRPKFFKPKSSFKKPFKKKFRKKSYNENSSDSNENEKKENKNRNKFRNKNRQDNRPKNSERTSKGNVEINSEKKSKINSEVKTKDIQSGSNNQKKKSKFTFPFKFFKKSKAKSEN